MDDESIPSDFSNGPTKGIIVVCIFATIFASALLFALLIGPQLQRGHSAAQVTATPPDNAFPVTSFVGNNVESATNSTAPAL